MKILRNLPALLFILIALFLIKLQFFIEDAHTRGVLEQVAYWIALFFLILIIQVNKYTSKKILLFALVLSAIGVFIYLVNSSILAETVFRIAFLIWLVGIIKSIIEFRYFNE